MNGSKTDEDMKKSLSKVKSRVQSNKTYKDDVE